MLNQLILVLSSFVFVIAKDTTSKVAVEILVTDIRSTKGQIGVYVFNDQESFKAEKAIASFTFNKQTMVNGTLKVKIDLPNGAYGLSLVDDENSNNDMDYNFVGMPKEGFGFSNYYHTGFTKPTFDQFKFEVQKEYPVKIKVKFRYI